MLVHTTSLCRFPCAYFIPRKEITHDLFCQDTYGFSSFFGMIFV